MASRMQHLIKQFTLYGFANTQYFTYSKITLLTN